MEEENPPVNADPPILIAIVGNASSFLATYGWFLIFGACAVLYLWKKYESKYYSWKESIATANHKKDLDADAIERRHQAQQARLQKMQEEYDRQAASHAVKQAELEEKKRQEKLEDWERHQQGLGYRSKVKKIDPTEQPTGTVLPKTKRKLRDQDYSPLMGSESSGSGSSSWRTRRGPAAGGG